MTNLDNFDWGWMDKSSDVYHVMPNGEHVEMGKYHRDSMYQEIFMDRCYEKFFEVEDGDIVLDIGASVGPFTYSILDKNPKHVFCFEPSESEFKSLVKNTIGFPVTHINKGISSVNSIVSSDMLFGGENEMETITFSKFINLFALEKINFIKTDCEGGEYDIFTEDNLQYLRNNVDKIVGEWHLNSPNNKEKFRNFRDKILSQLPKYEILSIDGIDIKWDLWNDSFIDYYTEVIVHIDNRK